MKNMSVKQKRVLIIIAVLILVVAVIGISFAVFGHTSKGEVENTIGTGTIEMAYSEASNTITINNAIPMTEKQAKELTNSSSDDNNYYFDFTVSSKVLGDATVNYDVVAFKTSVVKDGQTMPSVPDKDIRFRLEESTNEGSSYTKEIMPGTAWTATTEANDKTGAPSGVMLLYSGSFGTKSKDGKEYTKTDGTEMKRYFRLRMWVDQSYVVDDTQRTFSVIINVYGKTENE